MTLPGPSAPNVYVYRILDNMAERPDPLMACTGFDSDAGSVEKNRELHRVTPDEAEDMFFHEPLVVRRDVRRSRGEKGYYALGQTGRGRLLFSACTIRKALICIISFRDMNRREKEAYENITTPISPKALLEFRLEQDEREFWSTHDSTALIDWKSSERRRFPN